MARKIAGRPRVEGDVMVVTVEVENAYTDGRSRFDEYRVPVDALGESPTKAGLAAAILEMESKARVVASARDTDVDAEPTDTKQVWLERLARLMGAAANAEIIRQAAVDAARPQAEIDLWVTIRNQTYQRALAIAQRWDAAT